MAEPLIFHLPALQVPAGKSGFTLRKEIAPVSNPLMVSMCSWSLVSCYHSCSRLNSISIVLFSPSSPPPKTKALLRVGTGESRIKTGPPSWKCSGIFSDPALLYAWRYPVRWDFSLPRPPTDCCATNPWARLGK